MRYKILLIVFVIIFVIVGFSYFHKDYYSSTDENNNDEIEGYSENSNLLEGNTSIKKIQGNTIYLDSVKKNDVLKIDLQLDFDEYCLLEVTYYENKK